MTQPRLGMALPHDFADDRPGQLAAAEAAGYRYLTLADHVVGADTSTRPGWTGRYTAADPFREVFVHLGYLAALTTLELVPAVVVLPQRTTAVVAKQAAELAALCRGGMRLGVGAGWNEVEFDALGADFGRRADVLEEQLGLLRRLWTEPVVTFHGAHHHLDHVGIAPLPTAPVPLWLGGGLKAGERTRDRIRRRIIEHGDGWITPPAIDPARLAPAAAALRQAAERAGRDPATLGVQITFPVAPSDTPGDLLARLDAVRPAAPTHLTIDCRRTTTSPAQHRDLTTTAAHTLLPAL